VGHLLRAKTPPLGIDRGLQGQLQGALAG
jgi:hypothetical protein